MRKMKIRATLVAVAIGALGVCSIASTSPVVPQAGGGVGSGGTGDFS